MTHVVLHFEAFPAIGAGHAVRCLSLAEALLRAGAGCVIATHAVTLDTVPAVSDFPVSLLPADKGLAEGLKALFPQDCEGLVLDNYALTIEDESKCRPWAKRIMVIEDMVNRRHDADLLLDQTIGRDPADYRAVLPLDARVLAGAFYGLLRPQFAVARSASLARSRDSLRRVMVSMGATDPDNATAVMLEGLALTGLPLKVEVVLGATAPHRVAVADQLAGLRLDGRLHIQVQDMAGLMSDVDLVLGAGGSSALERCALGLPSIIVVEADNQLKIADNMAAVGASLCLGRLDQVTASAVAEAVCRLAAAPDKLSVMAKIAASVCDGRGADRAAAAFLAILG
ncbi:MAG TPA: UDP-2,4-diacetamido-2,4,6-trideoxy-beta-L-altropyranose hydrolase [Candidatus Sulfotelmatobacter sp.]|jgi:UDP-2,4-diacetamido-2,4,6-trideoxy-beta-L-altropyranose hydrolase|nr:UDP-2,4-diacetamido-2,4,6-trideoxy-beta-L-altropyranose hydrolase [Candidatus Sulfotelmatobacter sp.]